MDNVLVFQTSSGSARLELLVGVREFARGTPWNIQTIEFNGSPFPVRELMRFWQPVGCIVEASGNGLQPGDIPTRAFGRTPVVTLGGDARDLPPNASCVVHDARMVAEAAVRELLTLGIHHFAFLGERGSDWSLRRQEAFEETLALNRKTCQTLTLTENKKDTRELHDRLVALPKPCGLFAASDALAATALAVCRHANIAVPDDIAVIGVDDDEQICLDTTPTLTSIHPDFRQGGRFAARLLAKKIHTPARPPERATFGVAGITRRGSTRLFRRKDPDVAKALELIGMPTGVHLTPREILAGFPCSRRNAEIRFRQVTRHSVLDILTEARMSLAKRLLAETQLAVSDIAGQCGYSSQAHFRKFFKTATGALPLHWRKAHQ